MVACLLAAHAGWRQIWCKALDCSVRRVECLCTVEALGDRSHLDHSVPVLSTESLYFRTPGWCERLVCPRQYMKMPSLPVLEPNLHLTGAKAWYLPGKPVSMRSIWVRLFDKLIHQEPRLLMCKPAIVSFAIVKPYRLHFLPKTLHLPPSGASFSSCHGAVERFGTAVFVLLHAIVFVLSLEVHEGFLASNGSMTPRRTGDAVTMYKACISMLLYNVPVYTVLLSHTLTQRVRRRCFIQ